MSTTQYAWAKQFSQSAYVIDEHKLLNNLSLLKTFSEQTNIKIILALKGFANWKLFDIIRPFFDETSCSSVNELKLAKEFMRGGVHACCVAYQKNDFSLFKENCTHLVFNSLSQYNLFQKEVLDFQQLQLGLRINPEISLVKTPMYNPCGVNSRLGVRKQDLDDYLHKHKKHFHDLTPLSGIHVHALCEDDGTGLILLLDKLRENFGGFLETLDWLNLGGGHLITRKGYKLKATIQAIHKFQLDFPHLSLIMEPSSAFVWETGVLITKVLDVIQSNGTDTAIINASFVCHTPDCIEMPYKPKAILVDTNEDDKGKKEGIPQPPPWQGIIGGCSCLAGDYIAGFSFEQSPTIGDYIVFEDMAHYTTVKSTHFNGLKHPDIFLRRTDKSLKRLRKIGYRAYKKKL